MVMVLSGTQNHINKENKMLTESQAWAYVAQKFKNAKKSCGHYCIRIRDAGMSYGLCGAIQSMSYRDLISMSIKSDMQQKINDHGRKHNFHGYYWSINTNKGKERRANFAKRQAKLTKKK